MKERLCIAVAARILGMKKRKVKKELLHTPPLEITVFYFSVGYRCFFGIVAGCTRHTFLVRGNIDCPVVLRCVTV